MRMSISYWDHVFEMWAQWVNGGLLGGCGVSVLGKLIDNQGVVNFGNGRGGANLDCIEADVEAALVSLSVSKPEYAKVFRLEYNPRGLYQGESQLKRAHRLGISVCTYKRYLKIAREFIAEKLEQKLMANTWRPHCSNSGTEIRV